jgi:hypothetical protein
VAYHFLSGHKNDNLKEGVMGLLITVGVLIALFVAAPVDFLEDRFKKWGRLFGKENKVKATDKDGKPLN